MGEAVDRLLELAQVRVKAHRRRLKNGKIVMVRDFTYADQRLRVPHLLTPAPKVPEVPTSDEGLGKLQADWAGLDRDLLPYAGRPNHPHARQILQQQLLLQKAIHHANLDPGGAEGIGKPGGPRDVVIVGAGPAGLAASIYGGSEGLDTLLVDAGNEDRVGGQAGYSSRIENFIGFPSGISGKQLAETSLEQARRVGADCQFGVKVQSIEHDPQTGLKTLTMSDGSKIETRAVIIAGGVQFRQLNFPGNDAKGVIYGDSTAIKEQAAGKPVVMVGGANSAGQAAVDAASVSPHVTLLVRGGNISAGMSSYLVDQLKNDPKVSIIDAEVASVDKDKDGNVQTVNLKDGRSLPAGALGLFIGSAPSAAWAGVDLNEHGYVKTGANGTPMETSIPGVFAAGDIRAENMTHRVAVASGEGAATISYVHQYIPKVKARPSVAVPVTAIADDDADIWQKSVHHFDAVHPDTGVTHVEPEHKVALSHGSAVARLLHLTRSA